MPSQIAPAPRFQSFTERADPAKVAPRLKALRAALQQAGMDAFLVPRDDAHRGETVPPGEERLAWLTGFTGSAGMAIAGLHKAALCVDSRYTLQAPAQTDTSLFDVVEVPPASAASWIRDNLAEGTKIAFDPWLHTPGEIASLTEKLEGHASLHPGDNFIDSVWTDRPAPPPGEIEFLGANRAGKTASEKLADLQQTLIAAKADAVVLTLPESICWLFNMRGHDVPNTPVVLGFAIIPAIGEPKLFLSPDKLTPDANNALEAIADLFPKDGFTDALKTLADKNRNIWIDPATAPAAVADLLSKAGAELIKKPDPVLAPKAIKNDAELSGMREAHHRDGVALAKFLAWFDAEAPTGNLSEIDIVARLEAFRSEDETLVDISFDTISGAGAHGAIVHYRVTENTNRTLKPGELMLVDSGGQYLSGTTDITRTLFTGSATAEQKDRYTRVLKGMIAISMARFPKGTSGAQIDILARQFLWQAGVTYNHGTGHGVGAYLGVHEGPIGISPRYASPLEAGHIVSNEPGYYKAGAFGIRIENLVHVIKSEIAEGYLEFETLTLAPIDTRLIEADLMTDAEIDWLNAYHARVFNEIGSRVTGDVKAWLQHATAPL